MYYPPDIEVDCILGTIIYGKRADGCTHRNLVADLNKSRALQIVATCVSICISLQPRKKKKKKEKTLFKKETLYVNMASAGREVKY